MTVYLDSVPRCLPLLYATIYAVTQYCDSAPYAASFSALAFIPLTALQYSFSPASLPIPSVSCLSFSALPEG